MSDASNTLESLQPEPLNPVRLLKVAAPFLLFAVLFASPFAHVWLRWIEPEGYYSHGALIPFVTLFLILRKRKRLVGEAPPELGTLYAGLLGAGVLYIVFKKYEIDLRYLFVVLIAASIGYLVHYLRGLKADPWKPALIFLLPSLLMCALAGVFEIVSLGWLFVVTTITAAIAYYFGKRVFLALFFPLLILFTSVPLPEFIIQRVTLPMKSFATTNTVEIIQRTPFNITCRKEGAGTIMLVGADGSSRTLVVGAPCSGLRSLVALITVGLIFAYVTPLSLPKKSLLFLATIPASFLGNLFRLIALSLVTYQWDEGVAVKTKLFDYMDHWPVISGIVPDLRKQTTEPVHDVIGITVFIIAFILLFGFERVLLKIQQRQDLKKNPVFLPSSGEQHDV